MIMAKSIEKKAQINKGDSFDPGNVMMVGYVSIICFVLLVGSLVTAEATNTESVNLDDVSRGELLFKDDDGTFIPAPDLFRDVTINVSGLTARVKVKQTFVNETSSIQEAMYVFPLPDESAVDRLNMMIGERKIVGVIKEKQEAQKTYDNAKREGKKASLLVQKRPNMFTTRVANIGAGETVTVEIEYQQQVQYKDNTFSLRFPLAITPRYTPASNVNKGVEGDIFLTGEGWMMDIPLEEQASPLSLRVNLEAGMELGCVSSVYHKVQEKKNGKGSYQLSYDSSSKNYHDFVIEWKPVEGGAVNAALFSEEGDDGVYSLLMLMPPAFKTDYTPLRELIFIVDVSGSMAGASISQAKESLLHGLDQLKQSDSFNIIIFNNSSSALFDEPVLANDRSLEQAKKFVRSLEADGGTEMKPALEMAFAMDSLADEKSRVQQVVFMTDGAVSNEEQLFNLIDKMVENRRLFTVGIGSAPNSYFMRRRLEGANYRCCSSVSTGFQVHKSRGS